MACGQHRENVLTLGRDELEDALMLCVYRAVVGKTSFAPCPRRIEDLDERHRAFAIGTQSDTSRLVGTRQVSILATRECGCALGEETRGFVCSRDFGAHRSLLRRELECGRVAFGVGTRDLAAVLIEEGKGETDTGDHRGGASALLRAQRESELTN